MNVATHIPDDRMISDIGITFGEFKKTAQYAHGLDGVLRDVQGGQHLRFIGNIYKTPRVCLTAIQAHDGGYFGDGQYKNTCGCCTASTPKEYREMPGLHEYFTEQ